VPGTLRNYKTGSVIYFQGDVGDNIYILKSGAVSLIYPSIETGEEVRETIRNGEFFGVKSALAKRPREETAVVLKDAYALVLTNEEFEYLLTKNVKIITNFLRVFSNQLRKVGKLVHSFLDNEEVGDNQAELFKIGEYYLKKHNFKQARYVYNTYLKHYPGGNFVPQAKERLAGINDALAGKGSGTYAAMVDEKPEAVKKDSGMDQPAPEGKKARSEGKDGVDIASTYYDAVSLFSQERYEEAYKLFKTLKTSGNINEGNREYVPKIEYEMGRCLMAMKEYKEAVINFTNMIKNYPKDENVKDALFNIGLVYKMQGNKEKAVSFFQKVLKMLPESPIDRKAKKELQSLS
jgi:TolA-binding protein